MADNLETSIFSNQSDGGRALAVAVSTGLTAESSNTEINWPKVVCSIVISVIGLLGNGTVIFVILVLREYRKSVTHWYVLQLALADSLFLLTLPFKTSEDINKSWIYAEWMCKAKETVLFLNYYASIMFLMIMSIDRYVAVCHTFSDRLQKLRKPLSAVATTSFTWTICLLLCTPVMLYSAVAGVQPYCNCEYVFPKEKLSVYDQNNFTAVCLKEGFRGENISLCLQWKGIVVSGKGSTKHCTVPSKGVKDVFAEYANTDGYNYNYNYDNGGQSPEASGTGSNISGFPVLNNSNASISSINLGGSSIGDLLRSEQSTATLDQNNAISPHCTYRNSSHGWKAFMIFNFAAMFVLPVLVMIVCYGLIVRRLSATKVQSANAPNPSAAAAHHPSGKKRRTSTKSDRDRQRVTIMCAALVTCFIVLWLPFHVTHLAKLVEIKVPFSKSHICENLAVAGSLLAYVNSAFNPYLYSFLGTSFARRWKTATGSISKSFRRRTSSTSGAFGVRYSRKRSKDGSTGNHTGTMTTKMYIKGKPGKNGSNSETKPMDSTNAVFNTETNPPTTFMPNNGIEIVDLTAEGDHLIDGAPEQHAG